VEAALERRHEKRDSDPKPRKLARYTVVEMG